MMKVECWCAAITSTSSLCGVQQEQADGAMRFPVSGLPNKPLLMALLERVITANKPPRLSS
ncbi:hypothetical protein KCP74_06895 [Salmonella enterica subsp. enterica]|nr:hypothetical protein KCP74_06895 [Salmonella enterica subsp. enterica]